MSHVQARFANLQRERDIAVHDAGFGCGGHGAQAQPKTGGTSMHRSVFGESRIFRVLYHRKIQLRAKAESHAHDVVVENGLAVVGDGDGPDALQGAEVSERSSAASARGSGDGKDVDHGSALRTAQPGDPFWSIDYGRGVGHGADRSEPPGSSGGRTAGDGFFVALPGL